MNREVVVVDASGLGPYSPAVVAEGRFVHVAGQGPLRYDDYTPDTVAVETRLALDNLFRILAAAGAGPADVVRCGVYLVDIDDFDGMNAVYAQAFPTPRPARTTIQVAGLPGGIKVEIDCVAVLPV